jgi:hypothetical protein
MIIKVTRNVNGNISGQFYRKYSYNTRLYYIIPRNKLVTTKFIYVVPHK